MARAPAEPNTPRNERFCFGGPGRTRLYIARINIYRKWIEVVGCEHFFHFEAVDVGRIRVLFGVLGPVL